MVPFTTTTPTTTVIRTVGDVAGDHWEMAHVDHCEQLRLTPSEFASRHLPFGVHASDARYNRVGPAAAVRRHQARFTVSVPMHTCRCVIAKATTEAYREHALRSTPEWRDEFGR